MKRICANCRFWFLLRTCGDCRRGPPYPHPEGRLAVWALTAPDWSCGEFKPKRKDRK